MKVRAICQFTYAARTIKVGEDLDVDELTAKILKAQDKVTDAPTRRRGRPPIHGRYSRRDMRAEG